MKHHGRGFSLIELVLVIVVLSVAAVTILGLFSQASKSLLVNNRIQVATQLAQAGAEAVLARRRLEGFDLVLTGSTVETLTGHYAGYTRTTTISSPPVGGGCPSVTPPAVAPACKGVVVNVTQGGTTLADINLLLVDY